MFMTIALYLGPVHRIPVEGVFDACVHVAIWGRALTLLTLKVGHVISYALCPRARNHLPYLGVGSISLRICSESTVWDHLVNSKASK